MREYISFFSRPLLLATTYDQMRPVLGKEVRELLAVYRTQNECFGNGAQ